MRGNVLALELFSLFHSLLFKFGKEGADVWHTEVNINHQLLGLTPWTGEIHFATQVALIISSMAHVGSGCHRLDEMLSSNLQGADISILK